MEAVEKALKSIVAEHNVIIDQVRGCFEALDDFLGTNSWKFYRREQIFHDEEEAKPRIAQMFDKLEWKYGARSVTEVGLLQDHHEALDYPAVSGH